jgi:hypothetical protein
LQTPADGQQRLTLKDHVKALVSKCLEGGGLSAIEVQRRQDAIHQFLFPCYCNASMRGDDVGLAENAAKLMVRTKDPKKRKNVH